MKQSCWNCKHCINDYFVTGTMDCKRQDDMTEEEFENYYANNEDENCTYYEEETREKTILELAKENNINKVCIDGGICDIRQVDKQPFKVIPKKTEIMKNTIFNEPMLFAWTK